MVGPVYPGTKVFGWRDPRQFPELVGEMRLVGIAVLGGHRGPVDLGPSVEVPDHVLQSLDPGEALRSETHLRREPSRSGDHGARHLVNLAGVAERPERVAVQVDP